MHAAHMYADDIQCMLMAMVPIASSTHKHTRVSHSFDNNIIIEFAQLSVRLLLGYYVSIKY